MSLTALYVEDDDSTYLLVQTALVEAGLPVRLLRACDGDEGIAMLKSDPAPDAVLLDLNLPRVSGFEVLADMQRRNQIPGLPVYVLSTSAVPKDRERALQMGARDFHTKPSSFDGLVKLMESIFQDLGRAAALSNR